MGAVEEAETVKYKTNLSGERAGKRVLCASCGNLFSQTKICLERHCHPHERRANLQSCRPSPKDYPGWDGLRKHATALGLDNDITWDRPHVQMRSRDWLTKWLQKDLGLAEDGRWGTSYHLCLF